MGANAAKIVDRLRALSKKEFELASGTVISVDEASATCTVQGSLDDIEYPVLLRAATEDVDGLVIVPAVGSEVVFGTIDGPGIWVLIKTSKIDKAIVTIGETKATVTSEGYKIERGTESLTSIVKDLVNAIKNITVQTPSGPSSPNLINVAEFVALEQRIPNLLN